jgi:hypothetical protein
MGLIKLATNNQPIIVINHQGDPTAGSSKNLNTRNLIAAGIGGTTGFAAKELVEQGSKIHPKIPTFDKLKLSHRYGSRMASVGGAILGAGSVFAAMKKKKHDNTSNMYMF